MERRKFLVSSPVFLLLPRAAAAQEDRAIRLRDLYNKDKSFSDLALANEGQRITVDGFMAPPLKAESTFFVLTKMPMAVCPFCEPGQTWPDDILPVYTRRVLDPLPFNIPMNASGILELGDYVDPETGFFSKLRLTEAIYERG